MITTKQHKLIFPMEVQYQELQKPEKVTHDWSKVKVKTKLSFNSYRHCASSTYMHRKIKKSKYLLLLPENFCVNFVQLYVKSGQRCWEKNFLTPH